MSDIAGKLPHASQLIDYTQILHDVRIQFHTISTAMQVMDRTVGEGPVLVGDSNIAYLYDVMRDAVRKGTAILDEALPTHKPKEDEPFDLVKLVRGILGGVSVLADSRGFSMIYSGPEECILPEGKQKVERILYNVITNALNHTPSNTVVSISVREVRDSVRIAVSDQGFGLTVEQRMILTGPLPFPAGTEGMYGLRSARERADELGGFITVENHSPVGMTIVIHLPKSHKKKG